MHSTTHSTIHSVVRRSILTTIATAAVVLLSGVAGMVGTAVRPAHAATAVLPPDIKAKVIASLPPAGPVVTFTGKIPGTNAYLALVSRGGKVEAYVCDGDRISAWLGGSFKGTSVNASNTSNDVVLTAKRSGSTLSGTLNLKGKSYKVSAKVAAFPAGLYRADDSTTDRQYAKAGWILLADGTQRGALQVGTTVQPVADLSLATLEADIGGPLPSVVVPGDFTLFKKQKDKVVATPSAKCAALKKAFDKNMNEHNEIVNNGGEDSFFGNIATQQYQQGMALGCPEFPNPSGNVAT